jgi:hypothetical protein
MEKRQILHRVALTQQDMPVRQSPVQQFQPANNTKFIIIGTSLSTKLESELTSFLRENWDIFAWSPKDMPGVPRELAEHSLHVRSDSKPVKQPLRCFIEEKRKAIG